MEFLDIVVNEWASESNPHRVGIFIRNKGKSIEFTDGNGDFWEVVNNLESRFKIVGNRSKRYKNALKRNRSKM